MPARNIQHTAVIQALQADGWTITHDPLLIPYGDRRLFIDLGAERVSIGAERGSERIAVEISSFLAELQCATSRKRLASSWSTEPSCLR